MTEPDPLITQFLADLDQRKGQLESDRIEAQGILDDINEKLQSVEETWRRLHGDVAAAPAPAAPATKSPKPKAKPTSPKKASELQKAIVAKLRELLPQDEEWHELAPIRQQLLEVGSQYSVDNALKKAPVQRESRGHGKPWVIRWDPGAPQLAPVTEEQTRDYILEHKEGFSRDQLAHHFGRSCEWARLAIEPFLQRKVLMAIPQGHKQPDLLVYQQPADNSRPTSAAPRERKLSHDTKGVGSSVDLPKNKNMAALARRAIAQGCTIERMNTNHFRIITPDGRNTTISCTPSDGNAPRQARRALKRIGVTV